MRNYRGSIMLFALSMAAMGSQLWSSGKDTLFQSRPSYSGGGGHGNSGRCKKVMSKEQMARRRREKAARKARRKRKQHGAHR